jgi:hypothetical protein
VIQVDTVARTVAATSTTGAGQTTAIWMSTQTPVLAAFHRTSARGR